MAVSAVVIHPCAKAVLISAAVAYTTRNKDYLSILGWLKTVDEEKHRKELVAGDLASFAITGGYSTSCTVVYTHTMHLEYKSAVDRLGDQNVSRTDAVYEQGFFATPWKTAKQVLEHLPQVSAKIQLVGSELISPRSCLVSGQHGDQSDGPNPLQLYSLYRARQRASHLPCTMCTGKTEPCDGRSGLSARCTRRDLLRIRWSMAPSHSRSILRK